MSGMTSYGATVIRASAFMLPGSEYTHVIIETDQIALHSMLVLKNPSRIVLDIKNSPINNQLTALAKKNFSDDLYIKQVRIGNFKVGVTRIVFDLKAEVKPELNAYMPQGKYQHRLMLDLCPIVAAQKTDQARPLNQNIPNMDSYDANTSNSESSGAKIILDPSFDEDEMSTDAYD